MLKGKERSYLKKMAHNLKPIVQLGKDGLTENFIEALDKSLNDHELVKISVLKNSDVFNAKAAAEEICEELKSEFVSAMGSKIVIYRESRTKEKLERMKIPK